MSSKSIHKALRAALSWLAVIALPLLVFACWDHTRPAGRDAPAAEGPRR